MLVRLGHLRKLLQKDKLQENTENKLARRAEKLYDTMHHGTREGKNSREKVKERKVGLLRYKCRKKDDRSLKLSKLRRQPSRRTR
jgi:hypothetical protein